MAPATAFLTPNRTYDRRIALLDLVSTNPAIGVLEIREWKKLKSKRPRVRRYAVLEISQPGSMSRTFQLTKPDGGETRHVCLNSQGHDECVCKGFIAHGFCAHTQSLRAFCVAGHLPPSRAGEQPPASNPPHSPATAEVNDSPHTPACD